MDIPFLDRYSAEARLLPSLVLAIPPVLSVLALYPPARTISITGIAGAVAVLVLSHFVRSWGKAKEAELFRLWGGAPTTRRLRFRGAENMDQVQRLHDAITTLTGRGLPEPLDEADDPLGADAAYDETVALLREIVGDAPRSDLVVAENASYGMRRNLLGARTWGRDLSGLGVIVGVVGLFMAGSPVAAALAVIALNSATFWFWQWAVSTGWVREAAELYAETLFRATLAMAAARA